MYHYDPNTALEELTEEATLPNPVHVRDMILRKRLNADKSLELNRLFVEYQNFSERKGRSKQVIASGEHAPAEVFGRQRHFVIAFQEVDKQIRVPEDPA